MLIFRKQLWMKTCIHLQINWKLLKSALHLDRNLTSDSSVGVTFSVFVCLCVRLHRSSWAASGTSVCLPGDPAYSAAALLLLQDQDVLLP